MQADILIVGAGMVGSLLALALKNTGLTIVVLEAALVQPSTMTAKASFEPRVSALSLSSQRILQHVNAWNSIIEQRVSPYSKMYVWDGSGTGHIHFDANDVHEPFLGYIVENKVIQNALLEQLTNTNITLLDNTCLESLQRQPNESWLATLSTDQKIEAKLVVGSDGANSQVRSLSGMKTREWDYFHHAIVSSVRCEKAHQKTAWQRFTDTGPLAFLPLCLEGDEHWCSIVWSVLPDQAKQLMDLEDQAFCQKLGEAFEYKLGKVMEADPRHCLPLRQCHAKRYVQEGLALIGDAAHVIHPLAGQGVNLGFMDAAVLAETLQEALAKHESISDLQVLKRFECNRMPQNLAMMAAMEAFERLFQADPLAVRWLRNTGLKMVDGLPELKALFIRKALGLDGGSLPKMAMA